MTNSSSITNQNSYRTDAIRFFEWCRFNLNSYLEKVDAADKEKFESGQISEVVVFDIVRAAWADNLKNHLPGNEQHAAIKKALPNPRDYDAMMSCSLHLLRKLPKRIRATVAVEAEKRSREIHDALCQ